MAMSLTCPDTLLLGLVLSCHADWCSPNVKFVYKLNFRLAAFVISCSTLSSIIPSPLQFLQYCTCSLISQHLQPHSSLCPESLSAPTTPLHLPGPAISHPWGLAPLHLLWDTGLPISLQPWAPALSPDSILWTFFCCRIHTFFYSLSKHLLCHWIICPPA
jgi:hypothetical protein